MLDSRDVSKIITEMEETLSLFCDATYGTESRLLYESMRFTIGKIIANNSQHLATQEVNLKKDIFKRIVKRILIVAKAIGQIPALIEHSDYLVIANSRRKQDRNGYYEDPYTDPILDMVNSNYKVVEESYQGEHLLPTKRKVLGLDFLLYLATGLSKIGFGKPTHRSLTMIKDIKEYFSLKQIKVRIRGDQVTLANQRFWSRYYIFYHYLRLVHPKRIFLVCSYGKEPYIWAAKQLGIETIELQHGVITSTHLGYNFPSTKMTFPDKVLLFGEYWMRNVSFPIPSTALQIVGFPYLFREAELQPKNVERDSILFISQPTIAKKLIEFLAEFSQMYMGDLHVLYKLHPTECGLWRKNYPNLNRLANEGRITVIDSDTPSLYALMRKSVFQVGVYSTAIFEGYVFGCKTVLVDLPGVEHLIDLIHSNLAHLVADPLGLHMLLVNNSKEIPMKENYFFEPAQTVSMVDLLF